MKNVLFTVTAVAAALAASAAFADTNSIYITQIAHENVAVANQRLGHDNSIILTQNGVLHDANITQEGTFNKMDASQGYINNFTPEFSSAEGTIIALQHGDNNVSTIRQIGLQNTTYLTQGVSFNNTATQSTNENFSTNAVFQYGSNNSAFATQGAFVQ